MGFRPQRLSRVRVRLQTTTTDWNLLATLFLCNTLKYPNKLNFKFKSMIELQRSLSVTGKAYEDMTELRVMCVA